MIYGFDYFFFLMILRPPVSTRPATHFPDATLFRSGHAQGRLPGAGHADLPAQGPGPGTRASRTRPGARHDPDRRRRDLRHGLPGRHRRRVPRSEEHTSELQSLMRISYAVFCLKKKTKTTTITHTHN